MKNGEETREQREWSTEHNFLQIEVESDCSVGAFMKPRDFSAFDSIIQDARLFSNHFPFLSVQHIGHSFNYVAHNLAKCFSEPVCFLYFLVTLLFLPCFSKKGSRKKIIFKERN